MDTYFAPAERTERKKLKNQIDDISQSLVMTTLLKSVNGLLIILNEDRQIVAINHAFLDSLGIKNPKEALGLRLGESLHCVHSAAQPSGCGTTPHCATCGAAIAMMTAIEKDIPDEKICALTTENDGVLQDISLKIQAKPLEFEGNRWILISAQDITQQQFWVTLEHVFFHDINNMLSPIIGYSELLSRDLPERFEVKQIKKAAIRLGSEIALQRSLSHRKDARYIARNENTSIKNIRQEVDLIINGHSSAENKTLIEVWPTTDATLSTDSMLLSRILGNMLINAMEATDEGGTVKLHTTLEPNHVTWEVSNQCHIPDDVQKRIFQRHFSTKSEIGRGLGTYSMKLFGEEYLGGAMTFVSNAKDGTVFKFRLPLSNN